MRFPNFFVFLTVTFSLQIVSVYTDNSFIGAWTVPQRRSNDCPWCCAPVILNIQNAGSGRLAAQFMWGASDENKACIQLFSPPNYYSGIIALEWNNAGYYSTRIVPYSQSGYDTFYFQMSSEGKLNVFNAASFAPCNYVMTQQTSKILLGIFVNNKILALPSQTLSNILLIVFAGILLAIIVLRIYQNNLRETIVVQQLLEASKTQVQSQAQLQMIPPYNDAPVYVAPSMYVLMYQNPNQQTAEQNSPQTDPQTENQESQQLNPEDVKRDIFVPRADFQINLDLNRDVNKSNSATGNGFVDNRFEF